MQMGLIYKCAVLCFDLVCISINYKCTCDFDMQVQWKCMMHDDGPTQETVFIS